MLNITFLGLGAMGSRMAKHLLDAGYKVTVWNRTASAAQELVGLGAVLASSPREAAEGAEFVISMVRDDEASQRVWLDENDGALAAMPANAIAIESSTVSVDWATKLAKRFEQAGVAFVDAPVAGSRPQAENKQLIYFVGGENNNVEKVLPVLELMGGAIHKCGPVTSGAQVKLLINTLFAVQVASMAEITALLKASSLNENAVLEIIGSTPVCSVAAKLSAQAMLAGKFAPMFPIELVEKDLAYAENYGAEEVNQALPVIHCARDVMLQAKQQGLGDENINAVVKLYSN